MSLLTLLATVNETNKIDATELINVDEMVNYFWERMTELHWLYALLMISVGIVYMLYGWRIFKILVVISFGFMGMFLGIYAGRYVGSEIWGGVVGMVLCAIVSVPLMKWCISLLGAIAGGVITAGLWIAFNLSEPYLPAGFIVGFVAGGLISFILLKASVMLFTSLGGSLIMMTGMLALFYQYETRILTPPTNHINYLIYTKSWFLPMVLIVPTIIGMILQNNFSKKSHKMEV